MGHSGSKFNKFRNSFRRLSLSRNETSKKNETKIRPSRSLTNLMIKKKDVDKTEEKKMRRNTVALNLASDSVDEKFDDENVEKIEFTHDENIKNPIQENNTDKELKKEEDCENVILLEKIDYFIKEIEDQIEQMSSDDLFIYHATFKDEIHNFWIKAYKIKESNDKVKPKKNETIDYVKHTLHKLNNKVFQRNNSVRSDSYC